MGTLKILATGHSMSDFYYDDVVIHNSDFSKGRLAHCVFDCSVDFHDTNFKSALLENCAFGSIFLECDFSFSGWNTIDACGSVFENCLFFNVSFKNCDLSRAIFRGCTFFRCSFIDCKMSKTYFSCSSSVVESVFVCCDLKQVCLPDLFVPFAITQCKNAPYVPMVCPDEGGFIGYKKVHIIQGDDKFLGLAELYIPKEAARSSAIGRKCRCQFARVISITGATPNTKDKEFEEATSYFDSRFHYRVGCMVYPDSWDENRWNECSNGIHFFMNKQEALDY